MKIKKSWIIIAVIVILVFIGYSSFKNSYNSMVVMDENVVGKWAQVENVYQRRADLIPNLVKTVRSYAEYEQETLTEVVEARAKATSVTIDPANLNAASMQQFQQAQEGLSSALSKLLVVVEKYPELKANQNYLDLQRQLEGTENRITVERRRFNEASREYNASRRSFPTILVANFLGFTDKAYFKSEAGSDKPPAVDFSK